nr:MAG TPA: hypothetical protein [Caudoviricetes sp.]
MLPRGRSAFVVLIKYAQKVRYTGTEMTVR